MTEVVILEPAQRELEEIAELHLNLAGPNSARNITDRILAEVKGCNRVVYDLSPKPVATIEWE